MSRTKKELLANLVCKSICIGTIVASISVDRGLAVKKEKADGLELGNDPFCLGELELVK